MYNVNEKNLIAKVDMSGPLLTCSIHARSDSYVFSGGLAKQVSATDLLSGESIVLGEHDDAVRVVCHNSETGQRLRHDYIIVVAFLHCTKEAHFIFFICVRSIIFWKLG